MHDAVVVGSGPNGLAAAVFLAERGHQVTVLEASDRIGGGCRTEELTEPGFRHDLCSAVHPLGAASPYLSTLPLAAHGLRWIDPPVPLAHPLDDGTAAVLTCNVAETAAGLGNDERAWNRLMGPLVADVERTIGLALGPPLRAATRPLAGARFGLVALQPASRIIGRFRTPGARALFAGLAAHSVAPLTTPTTAGVALVLATAADRVGWPLALGGSEAITGALAGLLADLGGTIETGVAVDDLEAIAPFRAALLSTTAPETLRIGGGELSTGARRALGKMQPAPGMFKIDFAVDRPIPWTADACRNAGTVHVGGSYEEIARAEAETADGSHPDRPFVVVSQPSLFDGSRAPEGRHTVWAYCHAPTGSTQDMTESIVEQIERFAPGFSSSIIATHTTDSASLEAYNRNYAGGDITGGAVGLRGVLARPRVGVDPYRIGKRVWLCSASAPPGAGVHGMAGYHAARAAERQLR